MIEINSDSEHAALAVISEICAIGKGPTRENILAYEEMAKRLPQIEIPVKHYVHGGMYCREITIPKGALITGHIYKFDHLDIMISGDITVSTEDGERKRITGYHCFKSDAGKKRAGYAHEDTTWITVHPYGEEVSHDGDEIQRFITANNFEDLNEFNRLVNINDYFDLVNKTQMTEEQIRAQAEYEGDQIEMPTGFENIYVADSCIEGKGLFSTTRIKKGDYICPARLGDSRTPAGRYTNHALTANAIMVITDFGDIDVFAIRDIDPDEEITVNYRKVIIDRANKGDLCQE